MIARLSLEKDKSIVFTTDVGSSESQDEVMSISTPSPT